jgi:hypothetical protein
MRRYLIALAVALVALSVGASQAVAAPTAVAAKKCKKKKAKKKKCKKKHKQAPQGAPGSQVPSGPGTPGTPGTPAAVKATLAQVPDFTTEAGGPLFIHNQGNTTVTQTADGIAFGPYADGGAAGGSIEFTGLNGMTLADVRSLVFQARYTADGDSGGLAAPYLRVFLNDDAVDAIFSPNSQPDPDISEGPFHTWVTTSGVWRYDDDCGDGRLDSTQVDGCDGTTGDVSPYGLAGAPYSEVQGDHGDEVVSGIYISQGFSGGTNIAALLREWQINETNYSFGS